jgi:hypothetical protein
MLIKQVVINASSLIILEVISSKSWFIQRSCNRADSVSFANNPLIKRLVLTIAVVNDLFGMN